MNKAMTPEEDAVDTFKYVEVLLRKQGLGLLADQFSVAIAVAVSKLLPESKTMTSEQALRALRALYEKATPGEWCVSKDRDGQLRVIAQNVRSICSDHPRTIGVASVWLPDGPETDATNAALIVAMHSALPALLDEVEAMRWRPIETAPRDGTFYLVTDGETFRVENHPLGCYPGTWHRIKRRWFGASDRPPGFSPHLWMPLPAPPQET